MKMNPCGFNWTIFFIAVDYRENKEMNNFISLLDNTLQLNKDDDKSEEEELTEVKVKGQQVDETPRIPKSSSMPSKYTLHLALPYIYLFIQ